MRMTEEDRRAEVREDPGVEWRAEVRKDPGVEWRAEVRKDPGKRFAQNDSHKPTRLDPAAYAARNRQAKPMNRDGSRSVCPTPPARSAICRHFRAHPICRWTPP